MPAITNSGKLKMPLAFTVDKLDSVPETLRGEYVEKDGKFHLNVDGLPDVEGLKSALHKERETNKTTKALVSTFEKLGKSPAEISELLAQKEKEAEDALKKAGNFDEVLKQHLTKAAKERAEAEAKLTGERDTALSVARKAIVDTRVSGILAKLKATPEGMDLLVERLGKRIDLDLSEGKEVVSIKAADGTPMVGSGKDGLATFDDLGKEAVKLYPSLFEGTNAGGGGKQPGQGGGKPGEKTMPRSDWDALNPYEQAAKIRAGVRPVD
jgi:hypothetical protein